MKKIFSTVAMAIVAFVSVVSMSSCSNDDASSFNAAPQVTAQPSSYTFEYKAQLTNDAFTYFDIVLTRTDGTTSQELAFTEATKIKDYDAMQVNDKYVSQNSNVKYSVKVTPKSNWKELLEATGSNKIHVGATLEYSGRGCYISSTDGPVVPEYTVDSDAAIQVLANEIAISLVERNM